MVSLILKIDNFLGNLKAFDFIGLFFLRAYLFFIFWNAGVRKIAWEDGIPNVDRFSEFLGLKIDQKTHQNRSKITSGGHLQTKSDFHRFFAPFGSNSGAVLAPFWRPFCEENRCKIKKMIFLIC